MAYIKTGGILTIEGLNTDMPAEFLDDRQTPNCQNMEIDRAVLKKRDGLTPIGSSFSEVLCAGIELQRKEARYVFGLGETKLKYLSGTVWADVTLSGVALTADDDYRFDLATPMLSGSRILVGTNTKDVLFKCTGEDMTAAILAGSPPKCKFMIEYNAYLLLAFVYGDGDVAKPQRIQWCDTGNPENWTTGNSGAKDLIEGGTDITGLARYGSYVTVHKEDGIYVGYLVTTTATFKFDRKVVTGTVANETIQELPTGEQAYVAKDGIRLFNGSNAPLIESAVNDEIKEGLNSAKLHKCWSVVAPEFGEYWVGLPMDGASYANTVYKYNYNRKTCHLDTRTNIRCAFKYTKAGSLFKTIILGDASGNALAIDPTVYDDNSVAVDAKWDSKDYSPKEQGRFGQWIEAEVWAKGDTVTAYYSTDRGVTWTSIAVLTLASTYPADDAPLKLYFDVVSTKFRIRFMNNVSGEVFYLKQFVIKYRNREMR